MRRQPWGLYAIALAILIVGLVALGVPASTLLVAALVLACPLMMMFMMGGMHGGHGQPGGPTDRAEHGVMRRLDEFGDAAVRRDHTAPRASGRG